MEEKKEEIKELDNGFLTKGKNKILRFFFVMTIILSSLSTLYLFFPIFSFVICLILWVLCFIIVAVPTVFTLGTIFINEGFRNFAGSSFSFVNEIFNDSAGFANKINPYFIYFGFVTLGFAVMSLVLSALFMKLSGKKFIGKIIVSSIFLFNIIINLILFFANGQLLLGN